MNHDQLNHNDEAEITALLIGRRVVKATADQLFLDNGTVLSFGGNWGCGGCPSGNYDLTELNDCPNMIMAVEFDCESVPDNPDDPYAHDEAYVYRVFVFAENKRIKLLQVEGDDGNGYYGTGWWVQIQKRGDAK